MATDVTEYRRMEKTLRHLAKQLTSAQEDERRRISRELHDEAGQTITSLSLGLQTIQQTLSRLNVKDESITTALRDLLSLAESVNQSLRRIAHSLHPAALEYFGLSRLLQSFLLEIGGHSGKEVSVDISNDFPRLSTTVESTVYRIVQEAASNALKHAAAKSLKLTLRADDNRAMIRFEDDGRGFEKSSLEEFGGIGLISMRERAEMVGGEIEIDSALGEGTRITLHVPISDSRLEDRHLILNLSPQS